jgi:hypothetical protein
MRTSPRRQFVTHSDVCHSPQTVSTPALGREPEDAEDARVPSRESPIVKIFHPMSQFLTETEDKIKLSS